MCLMCAFFFFFFKQKTAYEMRISDWSSDVCSSDLDRMRGIRHDLRPPAGVVRVGAEHLDRHGSDGVARPERVGSHTLLAEFLRPAERAHRHGVFRHGPRQPFGEPARVEVDRRSDGQDVRRSEEHTSELQSLMRISYAVFCLKKKNKKTIT